MEKPFANCYGCGSVNITASWDNVNINPRYGDVEYFYCCRDCGFRWECFHSYDE